MAQIFSPKIVTRTPSRNRFRPSYYSHVTTRMGDLVPVLCKKVLPGDRWRINMSTITRLAPLANPVYDRVRITYDAFFVQNRIIDPDFKKFVSPDPEASDNPEVGLSYIANCPVVNPSSASISPIETRMFRRGGLMDMLGFQFSEYDNSFGLPDYLIGEGSVLRRIIFSAYPLLGYFKIWDNWYRNERFQTAAYPLIMSTYSSETRNVTLPPSWNSGETYFNEYWFLPVNYGKDLFTTALEQPLIGGPVNIPSGSLNNGELQVGFSDSLNPLATVEATVGSSGDITLATSDGESGMGSLVVDMKNAVLGTIQELKFAYALFSFYMKDTYNGNRYVEFMEAHFGVHVPDATLERSLFLGRITQWINFSEIFQTSGSTAEGNALGDYAGVGVGSGGGRLFDASFDEHGFLYILMSIRPNATYFQGVDRKWFYGSRFDELYFPEFQNIGDKPIFAVELFNSDIVGDGAIMDFGWSKINNTTIFGYNRANSEYIWFHDEMHGNFLNENSEYNWTFARRFENAPVLGHEFSKVSSISNPFTFTDDESLNYYTDIFFDIAVLRPVVRYEHY